METHVCENVHTEIILSSCYGFHQAVSKLDREHSVAVEKSAVWHTLTTPSELDWLKRSSGNVHPPQVSLLIQRGDRISRQLSRTVNHGPYVPHRERISNSSSSESKNRSNLSESEKSVKWALKEKRNIKISIYWIFWNISCKEKKAGYSPGVRLMASTLTMWEGWLSTSSNMGRPPLLQDSWKRRTISFFIPVVLYLTVIVSGGNNESSVHRNIPFVCAYTSRQTRPLFGRRNPGRNQKAISYGTSELQ